MSENPSHCVHCERSSDQVPLIALKYQEKDYWICPQHLPIVIHQPQKLLGKLPGAEHLDSEEHYH